MDIYVVKWASMFNLAESATLLKDTPQDIVDRAVDLKGPIFLRSRGVPDEQLPKVDWSNWHSNPMVYNFLLVRAVSDDDATSKVSDWFNSPV